LFVCALVALCGAALTGCKTNNRYELIEAELRTRERELAETRAALDQSRSLLRAYEYAQRTTAAPPGTGAYLPVKEIALGRGTGGVDEDGAPGDEALMVVIVPRDEDGAPIKAPGRALVVVWEVTPAGVKNQIGSWEVSADKLRRSWRSGFISTGYFVQLPWQTPPATDRLRVGVRFITTDGRTYETDRDVYVKPPLAPHTNVLPYPQPAPGLGSTPVPRVPTVTPPPGGGGPRQPVFPEMPPPGVPSMIPPGAEELPPPAPSTPERGARLLPPEKP
jgi:hypothetical protein